MSYINILNSHLEKIKDIDMSKITKITLNFKIKVKNYLQIIFLRLTKNYNSIFN